MEFKLLSRGGTPRSLVILVNWRNILRQTGTFHPLRLSACNVVPGDPLDVWDLSLWRTNMFKTCGESGKCSFCAGICR